MVGVAGISEQGVYVGAADDAVGTAGGLDSVGAGLFESVAVAFSRGDLGQGHAAQADVEFGGFNVSGAGVGLGL
ncbi:hypothetical protein OIO89_00800 (plasmid) [Mycobacterium ulcerans]|nr:hypothetical protein OIO89_00800 [Mycobacterium ulcerans]